MRTIEYRTHDKADWGEGPWQDEPDKVQWEDETTKLPCVIRRSLAGNWCGYVGIAPGHPLYGKGYDDLDLSVHGGLTFADRCSHGDPTTSICHVPDAGEPDDVWWVGFDCGHAYDLAPIPQYRILGLSREQKYRDMAYVKGECAKLARQLVAK
jgi:hypothetical protein